MAPISRLPVELLEDIFFRCNDEPTSSNLRNIALVSKRFNQVARPLIYRNVVIPVKGRQVNYHYTKYSFTRRVKKSLSRPDHNGLGYIRHLTLDTGDHSIEPIRNNSDPLADDLLLHILRSMDPNQLRSLRIDYPTFCFLRVKLTGLKRLEITFPPGRNGIATRRCELREGRDEDTDGTNSGGPETDGQEKPADKSDWCDSLESLQINFTKTYWFKVYWGYFGRFKLSLASFTIRCLEIADPRFYSVTQRQLLQLERDIEASQSWPPTDFMRGAMSVQDLTIESNRYEACELQELMPQNLQTFIELQKIRSLTIFNCLSGERYLDAIAHALSSLTSLYLLRCCTLTTLDIVLWLLPSPLEILVYDGTYELVQMPRALRKASIMRHRDSLRCLHFETSPSVELSGYPTPEPCKTDLPYPSMAEQQRCFDFHRDVFALSNLEELAVSVPFMKWSSSIESQVYEMAIDLSRLPKLRYLRMIYRQRCSQEHGINETPAWFHILSNYNLGNIPRRGIFSESPVQKIMQLTRLLASCRVEDICLLIPKESGPESEPQGIRLTTIRAIASRFPEIELLKPMELYKRNRKQLKPQDYWSEGLPLE
ncbi:hypothetical protein TWF696_004589 [Orbilia brochopaga]|uniref:F-box domain-containing protein n=1 Tax=Orbilia brochopaga TaxID=3140254 RepID=A0AAV9V6K2_9PEZI